MLTQNEWDNACADVATVDASAPPLVPVVLDGFGGLNLRLDVQDSQVQEFLKAAEV